MAPPAEDEELLAIVKETVHPSKVRHVRADATLRQVGIDSLTLVVIVGRFLERYPVPVEPLQDRFAGVKTIGDLLALGREARETWIQENGQA